MFLKPHFNFTFLRLVFIKKDVKIYYIDFVEDKMKDIKKELKDFQEFKSNYVFKQKEIEEINGKQYCEGEPLLDEEGKEIGDCEKWINVGYKYSGFPYLFPICGYP